jgi:hypothetical protein
MNFALTAAVMAASSTYAPTVSWPLTKAQPVLMSVMPTMAASAIARGCFMRKSFDDGLKKREQVNA